ncbi:hypothetical protein GQ54DRAFT_259882 [Martensiomyces pterosporus]|nr:hypothetical protein GQ54DRAFT_259882 [Martensiomyces pterosporus]
MGSRVDTESLYGSSIYRGGHFADEADLPEYAQLCRRLFPGLINTDDQDATEPEEEENIARYFKYLTGLPLASLKMEPTLLQSDLQRISNELTTLLLNETAKPLRNDEEGGGSPAAEVHPLSQEGRGQKGGEQSEHIFKIVYETHRMAGSAVGGIGEDLAKTQGILLRLESACDAFAESMADLDTKSKVVQCVLDKQDLISRIVELPRVMQMCVAGGYYEEAVEIAEHVRVTGDRLIQDISEDVQTLPGSKVESQTTVSARDQLVHFVGAIQKQVRAEFEAMILALCRELSYSRTTSQAAGLFADGRGYEKSMKRLSHVAKVVAILRSVGMFTEGELRMLYLRSRWQAWLQMAEQLSGFAPTAMAKAASSAPLAPDSLSTASRSRRGSDRTTNSAEAAAYLTKYIDAFCSWLAEVDMQYRTLFSAKPGADKAAAAGDPYGQFIDLATYGSQQLLVTALPLISSLTDASGISSVEALVTTHARILSRSKIDFVTPFLMQSLHERAFASVVGGIEVAVAGICLVLSALTATATGGSPVGTEQRWDQLAVSTRPSLALPEVYSPELASDPPRFLIQYRVSPVGLLQYPLLAKLLHSFRDSLHALRILVLAGDGAGSGTGGQSEVLLLLRMVSVVLESELIRIAEALAKVCADSKESPAPPPDERARRVVRDACTAFVFGLARNVSETFEEVSTLSEAVESGGEDGADSTITLYSRAIYAPLLPYLQ